MAHRLSTVVRLLQLICCCVFVLVGASATARAQPDGSQSVAADDNPESKKQARARILTSLEELSPAEQESFLQLSEVAWDLAESAQLHGCVDDAGCALDQAFTGDWKATLGGVVKKLGARGGWKTGVLADLLPAALLEDATAESSAEAFLQTSRDKPECAKLQGGEIVLFSDIPKCTQALVVRKDYELLRVHAADATRIDLVTIGKRTQLQSYSEDRLKLHRVKDDAAWFVFFVPRASSVTLRVFRNNGRVPVVRTFSSSEAMVDIVRKKPLCLLFDLRANNDAEPFVLVDGQDLERAVSVELPDERFGSSDGPTVTFLSPPSPKSKRYRRAETRVVRWSDLLPERCFAIQLDLSHEVGRVAITRTIVPPNCAAQGMTSTKLRSGAEAVLGDLGERVYKLQAWRNTVNDFGSALGELRPGRRFGASVGRFDSGDSLLANAAEAVRQGSRELIQLELSCSGDAPDRTDYTLHATRIDIVPLAETYDDVAGRDVDGDVSLISDVVHGQAELEGLLVRVLARLQGKPYIWTQPDNRLRRLQGATNERVSVYVPSDHEEEVKVKVTLDSYRLLSQEEYVCRKPDGSPGLSTQAVAKSFWGTRTPVRGHKIEQLRVSPGTESTSTMDWNPYGGGLYLLRVQATFADRSSVNTTFRCVEVQNQDAYVWFNLSYQRGLGPTPARAARDDSVSYGRLLLGMARATAYDGSFNFGVTAGYGNAVYSRSTPTAWELTPATGGVSPVPTGPVALPINWTRQSLLFGPAISVRWSGPLCQLLWGWTCTRPLRSIDLVARALPLLDIGIVNTSSVDPQLRRMLDGRDGLDLDLSASLEAGVMVHLGPTLSLELQGNVGVLGWDDLAMGGRDQSEAQSSITYDAHFIAGGSMGMLWGF